MEDHTTKISRLWKEYSKTRNREILILIGRLNRDEQIRQSKQCQSGVRSQLR